MKKIKLIIGIIIIIIVIFMIIIGLNNLEKSDIIEISSQKELEKIYEGKEDNYKILKYLTTPFSLFKELNTYDPIPMQEADKGFSVSHYSGSSLDTSSMTNGQEYSTTNIQVENVDEADITKTDGEYLYSLSENNVIITNAQDPEKINIVSKISENNSNTIPSDLILYKNKLIIIYEKVSSGISYAHSYNNSNTLVSVYDISNKQKPIKIKYYELEQPYYTSRCIDGRLYVIASGNLRKNNDNIITYYKEDGKQIDPGYNNIKRIKDIDTRSQTILSMLDLNNINTSVKVNSYLMNVENAYISENSIYLLEERHRGYLYNKIPEVSSIFGIKGILGAFDLDNSNKYEEHTNIYKFNILEDGSIQYSNKAKEKGKTIDQFSIDEYENNLRMAIYDEKGSRIVIFDENMKKIGETEYLAQGEKMYSSRFIENKVYLVTYKTIDPLFVIDLSNVTNPKVLGELKIPGYSTYLHPYDENHIIGIGMQTEEKIRRNSSGKVISTTAIVTGMKMALFDVSNVNDPIQISDTIIGDHRTTSSILTNHKALLFSKEKQLLAIPVNNYNEDFEITNASDSYSTIMSSYTNYDKEYISEGYLVYNINLTDGFKLKGSITHDASKKKYSYSNESRLLRGLYINNNLFTISEDYIKVNRLDDLKEINQLKIKED